MSLYGLYLSNPSTDASLLSHMKITYIETCNMLHQGFYVYNFVTPVLGAEKPPVQKSLSCTHLVHERRPLVQKKPSLLFEGTSYLRTVLFNVCYRYW